MELPEAMLYVLVHHWRTIVPIVVIAVMVGKSWPSETFPSGDHGLLFGSIAYGTVTTWVIFAALAHIYTLHVTQVLSR